MTYKMKGSSFYGHGNASPAKTMPSYIDGVMVSDIEADNQERKVKALSESAHKSDKHWDKYVEESEKVVTRKGPSQVKHIKKTAQAKGKKLDQLDKDMIKKRLW